MSISKTTREAHPVGAVVCCVCGCAGRSDEMQYHNHGDGVETWTCEPCQGVVKDCIAEMYQRFLKRCDE